MTNAPTARQILLDCISDSLPMHTRNEIIDAFVLELAEKIRAYSCCDYAGCCPGDCGSILADFLTYETPQQADPDLSGHDVRCIWCGALVGQFVRTEAEAAALLAKHACAVSP